MLAFPTGDYWRESAVPAVMVIGMGVGLHWFVGLFSARSNLDEDGVWHRSGYRWSYYSASQIEAIEWHVLEDADWGGPVSEVFLLRWRLTPVKVYAQGSLKAESIANMLGERLDRPVRRDAVADKSHLF